MNDSAAPFRFVDLQPPGEDFRSAVRAGLRRRVLSPQWFYDERGSALFERICRTAEYYVTRTELALLERIAPELGDLVGPAAAVIEYGTGSTDKVRRLLGGLQAPHAYLAIDISREHLRRAAGLLAAEYPTVQVTALCADFTAPFALPDGLDGGGRRLGFFPGSTIGNQAPEEARAFLERVRGQLGPDGALLIGVDLVKDAALLDAAYNDAEGVTAAFNLNVLHRIRSELRAVLDPEHFEHVAFFNAAASRVEMHLRARRATRIVLDGEEFSFAAGDALHTENSYKYTVAGFRALAVAAGFGAEHRWVDEARLFSIHYLTADPA